MNRKHGPAPRGIPAANAIKQPEVNEGKNDKEATMKQALLILVLGMLAAFSNFSHAQLFGGGSPYGDLYGNPYGGSGAYACTAWQPLGRGIGGQKYKRKCQNANNSFDRYWEVCTPSYSGWNCRNAGQFEPRF